MSTMITCSKNSPSINLRNSVLTVVLFCFATQYLFAQQLPLFTQYADFRGLLNPSSVTNDYLLKDYNVTYGLSNRYQWIGVSGNPRTYVAHADYTINTGNTFNFLGGAYLLSHNTGPIKTTGIYGRLASIMSEYDPRFGGFSFGMNLGMVRYSVSTIELAQLYPSDILTSMSQNKIYPDVGLGISYYKNFTQGPLKDDIFNLGFSVPQMLGLNLLFRDDTGEFNIGRVRHFYTFLSYLKSINEESFLEFSSWLKYVPAAPLNLDVNLRYQINPTFYIGSGLSTAGIGHFEFGLYLDDFIAKTDNRFRIGLSYDPSFTSYGARFGGSYELSIGYALNSKRDIEEMDKEK